MTELLDRAMSAASTLSDEDQDKIAHVVLDEAKRLSILEGIADADAGRMVPHSEIKEWLESWGTENELPPPTRG